MPGKTKAPPGTRGGARIARDLNEQSQKTRDANIEKIKSALKVKNFNKIFPANLVPQEDMGNSAIQNLSIIATKYPNLNTFKMLLTKQCTGEFVRWRDTEDLKLTITKAERMRKNQESVGKTVVNNRDTGKQKDVKREENSNDGGLTEAKESVSTKTHKRKALSVFSDSDSAPLSKKLKKEHTGVDEGKDGVKVIEGPLSDGNTTTSNQALAPLDNNRPHRDAAIILKQLLQAKKDAILPLKDSDNVLVKRDHRSRAKEGDFEHLTFNEYDKAVHDEFLISGNPDFLYPTPTNLDGVDRNIAEPSGTGLGINIGDFVDNKALPLPYVFKDVRYKRMYEKPGAQSPIADYTEEMEKENPEYSNYVKEFWWGGEKRVLHIEEASQIAHNAFTAASTVLGIGMDELEQILPHTSERLQMFESSHAAQRRQMSTQDRIENLLTDKIKNMLQAARDALQQTRDQINFRRDVLEMQLLSPEPSPER